MHIKKLGFLVGILCVFPATKIKAQDGNSLLRTLNVLILADTDDKRIGTSVNADAETISRLFKSGLRGAASVSVLKGKDATLQNVVTYLQNLKSNPNTGIVIYFCGHGGIDATLGQTFDLNNSDPIVRKRLVDYLNKTQFSLKIVLSDCCSSIILPKHTWAQAIADPDKEVMSDLFLRARGTLVYTSAKKGTFASGGSRGGCFTLALASTLASSKAILDINKDQIVNWSEVFTPISQATQTEFAKLGEQVQKRQEPEVIIWPEDIRKPKMGMSPFIQDQQLLLPIENDPSKEGLLGPIEFNPQILPGQIIPNNDPSKEGLLGPIEFNPQILPGQIIPNPAFFPPNQVGPLNPIPEPPVLPGEAKPIRRR